MDPKLSNQPTDLKNSTSQQQLQEIEKQSGKPHKYKLPIFILIFLLLILTLGVIFAVINGYLSFGSNNDLTINKVKIIKQEMDKICNDYGYYDKQSVNKIDRYYPNGAYMEREWIDLGCLDQDNASGEWPNRCSNGYIDYVLRGKSSDAPGDSERNEDEYGGEWYQYYYKFTCNSVK